MTRCPFPNHNDSNPSFQVRNQGRHWVCYGCDRRGGAIDLVKEYFDMSFIEAKRWLAKRRGYASLGTKHSSSHLKRTPTSTGSSKQYDFRKDVEGPPDHEVYHFLLSNSPLRDTGAHYLAERGLKNSTIDRFKIGQTPNTSILKDMISKFGFDRVNRSGLLTKLSNHNNFRLMFPSNSILFPFIEDDKIEYIQGRIIGNQDRVRWRNLYRRRQRVYNVDVLKDKTIDRIAICEGVMDVISAAQLKCEAIGLIGVSARLSERQIGCLKGREVELLLDWDEAGERRSVDLRRELSLFGVMATRRTKPKENANDINDLLRQGYSSI